MENDDTNIEHYHAPVPTSAYLDHYRMMARYNAAWNENLWKILPNLDSSPTGWLLRVLEHVLAADEVWLARFEGRDPPLTTLEIAGRPRPADEFWFERMQRDRQIKASLAALTSPDLLHVLEYHDRDGREQHEFLGMCFARLFNHQAHHQFKITTTLYSPCEPEVPEVWDCGYMF